MYKNYNTYINYEYNCPLHIQKNNVADQPIK